MLGLCFLVLRSLIWLWLEVLRFERWLLRFLFRFLMRYGLDCIGFLSWGKIHWKEIIRTFIIDFWGLAWQEVRQGHLFEFGPLWWWCWCCSNERIDFQRLWFFWWWRCCFSEWIGIYLFIKNSLVDLRSKRRDKSLNIQTFLFLLLFAFIFCFEYN